MQPEMQQPLCQLEERRDLPDGHWLQPEPEAHMAESKLSSLASPLPQDQLLTVRCLS